MSQEDLDSEKVHVEFLSVQEPPSFRVFLLNDDYTSMDFVIHVLKTIFHKTDELAEDLMWKIHNEGKGLCGEYTFEIAETKVHIVHQAAQQAGFPLRCIME